MTHFIELAKSYRGYHQKALTYYLYLIGGPIMFFASMIFLGFIHLVIPETIDITFAEISAFFLIMYYIRLQWRLALVLLPFLILLLFVAHLLSAQGLTSFNLWTFALGFIASLVMQGMGFILQKHLPPLHSIGSMMLLAPMFLVAEGLFKLGKMQDLKNAIEEQESTQDPSKD